MIKLFDSIASLEFLDTIITEQKVVIGMHAKDGEYVKFINNCDCSGPVSCIQILYNFIICLNSNLKVKLSFEKPF